MKKKKKARSAKQKAARSKKQKNKRFAKNKKSFGKKQLSSQNIAVIGELIERGRPRGFVTDNEILYYFPKIEEDVSLLEEIYDRLKKPA